MAEKLIGLPKGESLRRKYIEFRDSDAFTEMGWAGLVNLGKTHALVDCGFRRMMDYPSMNVILSRDTAKSLRESSIKTFKSRLGDNLLPRSNNNELIYETPKEPHPVTGDMVASSLVGIGLDRTDLDETFRSKEYGTSLIDEGNTVETRAHDIILSRLRQKVYHKRLTILDQVMDSSKTWKVSPEIAYDAMLACPRNPVGLDQLPLDHPMPAKQIQRTVWNPAPNEMIWDRYVGVAYPNPHPTVEWVNKYVGIREKLIDNETLRIDRYEFIVGDYVYIDRMIRGSIQSFDERTKTAKIFGMLERIEYERIELLLQRRCLFGFTHENKSRVVENDKIMYFMEDKSLRNRIKRGAGDRHDGRIFPEFRDDDVSMGGHTIEVDPAILKLATIGYGGVDQGGGHATSIPVAAYIPSINGLLIYDGHSRSGEPAASSAQRAKEMVLPHFSEFWWGYDPSMEAKEYGRDLEYSLIQEYWDVLGEGNMIAGEKGDAVFDYVNSLLQYREADVLFKKKPMPRLLIDNKLEEWIEMLSKVTWKHNRINKHEWVDMADSVKVMCSVFRKLEGLVGNDIGDYDSSAVAHTGVTSTLGEVQIHKSF